MKLWKLPLRHYLKHPWQIVFSLTGIALGVAVVVAIDLANNSAQKALELTNTILVGSATHHIVGGPRGLDDKIYTRLRINLQLEDIAPRLEGYGNLLNDNNLSVKTFQIIGIDVMSEPALRHHFDKRNADFDLSDFLGKPNTALMLDSSARSLGLERGGEFTLSVGGTKHNFSLAGVIHENGGLDPNTFGSVLYVDIATAQEILNSKGKISQIDLILPKSQNLRAVIHSIEAILPENATIVTSASQGYALTQMTNAFQLNLTALSLLALIVGVFLIYNTMTFSIIQRRTTFGHLRILGATRRRIFFLIMLEALAIGILATVIGLLLGIALGSNLLNQVTETVNDLSFALNASQLQISTWSLTKGALVGVGATIAAVILPAIEATKTTSQASNSRSQLEFKYKNVILRFAVLGALLGIAGYSILKIPGTDVYTSFIGLFVIIVGFAFIIPLITLFIVQLIMPAFRRVFGSIGVIAIRGIAASFSRTGVAITSLAIAIATSVGVAIMISSFRASVVDWLDDTLYADIFITPVGLTSHSGTGNLSSKWLDKFNVVTGVHSISIYRNVQVQSPDGATQLNVLQIPHEQLTSFKFSSGNKQAIRNTFYNDNIVLVSEPYAYHQKLKVGDSTALLTDKGLKDFTVAGIYIDYGSEKGVVTISRTTYLRHWKDRSITSLGVYAVPGTNTKALKARLRDIINQELASPSESGYVQDLTLRTNDEIRTQTIEVFDHTFAITEVLRMLAIGIAFIGILSALMAIQIERGREIALLRALGMSPKQVWFIIGTETGVIGTLVGGLALLLGIAIAGVLILVINQRSYGWSMDMNIEPMILVNSMIIAIAASMLAGAYPSFRMSRISPANALRED